MLRSETNTLGAKRLPSTGGLDLLPHRFSPLLPPGFPVRLFYHPRQNENGGHEYCHQSKPEQMQSGVPFDLPPHLRRKRGGANTHDQE
jgi:hypothetical protein